MIFVWITFWRFVQCMSGGIYRVIIVTGETERKDQREWRDTRLKRLVVRETNVNTIQHIYYYANLYDVHHSIAYNTNLVLTLQALQGLYQQRKCQNCRNIRIVATEMHSSDDARASDILINNNYNLIIIYKLDRSAQGDGVKLILLQHPVLRYAPGWSSDLGHSSVETAFKF